MEKKKMSLDEQIAEAQRKFAEEKRRIKQRRAKRVMLIGEAVVANYEGLIDRFDEVGFDVNAFVKSTEFQRHFYDKLRSKPSDDASIRSSGFAENTNDA